MNKRITTAQDLKEWEQEQIKKYKIALQNLVRCNITGYGEDSFNKDGSGRNPFDESKNNIDNTRNDKSETKAEK